LLSSKALQGSFDSRILILFLGGFFLALAASRYRLDVVMAKTLLKPFGTKPAFVILGLMIITALFSMFMSNTATTAMMLAVLTPVLASLPENDPGRTGAILAIPLAANIGSIGTPIGTPPNAVALGTLGEAAPNFLEWMTFGVPYVVVLLFIAWCLLLFFHKPHTEQMSVEFEAKLMKGSRPLIAYVTCAATVLLWLTGPLHGINSYAVAMVTIVVFCATGIVSAKDLRGMGWDILWLVAGGVALGMALSKTGLTAKVINSIPFASMPIFALVGLISVVTALMATFMSNTATANLMLPLVATLGTSLATQLDGIGGSTSLVIAATIAASMGMALPISTPPNAIAYGSGMINTKQMAMLGSIVTVIGLLLLIPLLLVFSLIGGI
jgi:sodium-dependent dicarboxylate transporter 2/3/5